MPTRMTPSEASLQVGWDYCGWAELVRHINPDKKIPHWQNRPDLERCRFNIHKDCKKYGVYARPMSFLRAMSEQLPDTSVTGSFGWTIKHVISSTGNDLECFQFLKGLSTSIELATGQLHIQGQMLLGIERCTPPIEWDKQELISTATHWVSATKSWGSQVRDWITEWVRSKRDNWAGSMDMLSRTDNLTFDEFCRDPVRWATSGGAPKVRFAGRDRRSKWAWAMHYLSKNKDLYAVAKSMSNVAHVALKEEPAKTRLVITTPMASYLRQAYVMYLHGVPQLNSPIYSNEQLNQLYARRYNYYLSIDATAFDTQIPKWFIKQVISALFTNCGQEQLLQQEMESLDSLRVELFGKYIMYNGGVLSGWRLTSMLGTLASQCYCEYLRELHLIEEFIVQGDDILCYGDTPFDTETIYGATQVFGLKCDPASFRVCTTGTFLRRTFGGRCSLMSFGRALHQIFYAHPWVDRLQFQDPVTIAASWKQMISRCIFTGLKPWLLNQAASDMARWARWPGWDRIRWYELLTTDSGLGGLGTVDTHVDREYVPQLNVVSQYVTRRSDNIWERAYLYFVPDQPRGAKYEQSMYRYSRVPPYNARAIPSSTLCKLWDDGDNKTEVCMRMIGGAKPPKHITHAMPHWLRIQPWWRKLDWIFKPEEIAAPQHLAIPQHVMVSRMSADVQSINRYMRTLRGGTVFKMRCMYLTLLARASRNVFYVGSW